MQVAKMAHEQQPIPESGTEVERLGARIRTASDDAVLSMKTIGQALRSARERRGNQLDDVGRAIKIRPDHLAAIEEGRFEELPSRAFIIGYVSRYARYLGLEDEKLLERLEAESGAHDGHRRDIEPISDPKFRVSDLLPGLLLAALTIIAYGMILYWILYLSA
jgi:cytoskeleton protein RodZ